MLEVKIRADDKFQETEIVYHIVQKFGKLILANLLLLIIIFNNNSR